MNISTKTWIGFIGGGLVALILTFASISQMGKESVHAQTPFGVSQINCQDGSPATGVLIMSRSAGVSACAVVPGASLTVVAGVTTLTLPPGTQGPRGLRGFKGATGATGAVGPPGAPGGGSTGPMPISGPCMHDDGSPGIFLPLSDGTCAEVNVLSPQITKIVFGTYLDGTGQPLSGGPGGLPPAVNLIQLTPTPTPSQKKQ